MKAGFLPYQCLRYLVVPIALVDNMTFMPGVESYVLQMPGLSASCLAAKGRGQFTTLKAEGEARKATTSADKEDIQATSES